MQKDIRENIVKSAQRVFAKYGLKKTTMDEIARASQKAKSSIYYYFKSKEEVFQAVIEKEIESFKDELTMAIGKENLPQKKLRAYVVSRLKGLRHLVNYYNALKDEYFEYYGFFEKLRKKYDEEEVKMIRGILREGVKKGVFVIKDLNLTANAIVIALKGFESPWIKEKNYSKIVKHIDKLFEVFFNGILKR